MELLIIALILICLVAFAATYFLSLRRFKQPSASELPICEPILYRYDCPVGLAQ